MLKTYWAEEVGANFNFVRLQNLCHRFCFCLLVLLGGGGEAEESEQSMQSGTSTVKCPTLVEGMSCCVLIWSWAILTS